MAAGREEETPRRCEGLRWLRRCDVALRLDTWRILHIPENPPISPHQQPTVNVYASPIEPKLTNTIVRRLNQALPLENLRHVKRVQKKSLEGGKTQLSVILCLAGENDSQLNSIPQDVQELINSYQLSPFITKVCKYAASSKEEWEEQCKLWPTSYHPPTYNIDGITGFSEEDSQSVFSFMKFTVELAKSGDGSIVNAAVIVDPLVKQVIVSACDQVCTCSFATENSIESCSKKHEALGFHPDSNGVAGNMTLPSNVSVNENKQSYTSVSCLNPWQWAHQKSHSTSCNWHPLRHAAMVAIESSALRDRSLYPSVGHGGDNSIPLDSTQSSSTGTPAKRHKTDLPNIENGEESEANTEVSYSTSARPYLCTGYDIYLVWEPCVMCAMALVHQRIRRIFYAFPNPNAGALGSVHRLQGEKSLNHHYAVFRVFLPEEILEID
ncbi:tRNA-specific adenosine deaminase TAD3 [Pistacia vera]|uniref:tRNA-specific adenosine deaminase TAD3 n=1 Tax=Pistacia vera TaxID=55513 RepID=UPI001262BB62|nr:tRNA-specific adenosine deaminase TAD3 [Pistacia vera]